MKIKLSKSEWVKIGKMGGWVEQNSFTIKGIIDDGQRAYRLRKSIGDCPSFDDPVFIQAWKHGYRSSMRKFTLEKAFNDFINLIE